MLMNIEKYQKRGSRFVAVQKSGLHIKNCRCSRNIEKIHELYKQLEKLFIDSKFTVLKNSHIRFT